MAGLYIHIPFCASRCIYCGFYSTTLLHLQDRYIDAVCREMELRRRNMEARERGGAGATASINTIYIGGGTPSQLSAGNLRKLFHNINKVYLQPNGQTGFENVREITIECNPDDVTDEFVSTLSQLPVNRISMGAQTFSDERLRFLHRRHNAHQVVEAVGRLRKAGFRNISIDLMFGFPGEILDDWQRDIDEALALGVEHISAYSLMVEEGTELYRLLKGAGVTAKRLPEQERENEGEREREMYELLIDRLTSAGYEHYEISNFALKNEACRMKNEESFLNAPADSSFFILHLKAFITATIGTALHITASELQHTAMGRFFLHPPRTRGNSIATGM